MVQIGRHKRLSASKDNLVREKFGDRQKILFAALPLPSPNTLILASKNRYFVTSQFPFVETILQFILVSLCKLGQLNGLPYFHDNVENSITYLSLHQVYYFFQMPP